MANVLFALLCLASMQADKQASSELVDIKLALKNAAITEDRQPAFTITFENRSNDYINLYNVGAYWKWQIAFERVGDRAGTGVIYQMQFEIAGAYVPLRHEQIKVGEHLDVAVDLNDPAYLFQYAKSGSTTEKTRHLPPGRYKIKAKISLEPPFPDSHEWKGPIEPKPVDLRVLPASKTKPSAESAVKWNKAIDQVVKSKMDRFGLWQNGAFASVKLPEDAQIDDVVASAVNSNLLGSKAYQVLMFRALEDQGHKTAVLVHVGNKDYVLICYYIGSIGWWSRFYDAELN